MLPLTAGAIIVMITFVIALALGATVGRQILIHQSIGVDQSGDAAAAAGNLSAWVKP